jgi:uracil-DNA glycosylase family 4
MSDPHPPSTLHSDLFADTAALLRHQSEHYGLTGLQLAPTVLQAGPQAIFAAGAQAGSPVLSPPGSQAAHPAASGAASTGDPATAQFIADHLAAGEDRAAALATLRESLINCQRCPLSAQRSSVVFGQGPAHAKLMFVGEAPGRDEDLQGQPFVGESGRLLTKMIVAMGLQRSEVYIANIVKCRPPRNRDPEPLEVATCQPFLRQQIALIAPQVLVGLGRYAVQTLLKTAARIGTLRGTWQTYAGIDLMPTFHPAYLLRNPADKKLVWSDLQQVMRKLAEAPPRQGLTP